MAVVRDHRFWIGVVVGVVGVKVLSGRMAKK